VTLLRAASVFAGFRFPPEVISPGATWAPPGASSPGRCAPERFRPRSRQTAPRLPVGTRRAGALGPAHRWAACEQPIEADHGRL